MTKWNVGILSPKCLERSEITFSELNGNMSRTFYITFLLAGNIFNTYVKFDYTSPPPPPTHTPPPHHFRH